MELLAVAQKDLLIVLRDRKALFLMIVFPLVIIAILGFALGPMFREEEGIERFNCLVVNLDEGPLGRHLVEDVLGHAELRAYIRVVGSDAAGAREQVRDGKAPVAVFIPAGFSADVLAGRSAGLEVIGHEDSPLRGSIVRSVVTAFANEVSATQVAVSEVAAALGRTGPEAQIALLAVVRARLAESRVTVEVQPIQGRTTLSAGQYYAAAMSIMFSLFGVAAGAKGLLEEREQGTLRRMLTAPLRPWHVLGGKLVGIYCTGALQFAVLLLGTAVIFRVDWGAYPLAIAAIALATSLAGAGLMVAIAAFARTTNAADGISMLVIQITNVFGGGTAPLYVFPEPLLVVSRFTITGQALRAFLAAMGGEVSMATVGYPCLVLAAIGLIGLAIGSYRLGVTRGVV